MASSQSRRLSPRYIEEVRTVAGEITLLAGIKMRLEKGATLREIADHMQQTGFAAIPVNAETTLGSLKAAVETKLHATIGGVKHAPYYKELFSVTNLESGAALAGKGGERAVASDLMEKTGSGIGRLFEQHQNWVAGRSSGRRLGISVAEVGLGIMGMNAGVRMIQESRHGVEGKKSVEPGASGNPEVTFAIVPMSGGKRAFKAVAGTALTAAGISALLLGTMNFSAPDRGF